MKVKKINTARFGARLKELREPFGSMQQFCDIFNKATESNLSPAAISRWEKGEREPYLSSFVLLADFFCVSFDYMLGLSNCKNGEDDDDGEL